jgi:uncharacterized protein (DUF58 family)
VANRWHAVLRSILVRTRLVALRERVARRLARRAHKFTTTGALALGGAVIPWLVGYVIAGPALYVFAYATVLLIVLSYVLAPRATNLTAQRIGVRRLVQQGDNVEVAVEVTAGRTLSTFVLEEQMPARLGRSSSVRIPKIASGASVEHRYALRCRRRGAFEVGPLVAVTSDPLGLTERRTTIAEPFELIVHPKDRPLTRRFEDPPVRPPVSRPWPSGLEFYGMRDYQPGDELRRIVWRASARMGKLMVREAEEGITDQITVILDTDTARHTWDGDESESFEVGVRAAASLALNHLRDGYEVRSESNAGPIHRTLRGSSRTLELLDAYARIETQTTPLLAVLRRLAIERRNESHTILITPHLGEHEAAQLRALMERGASIMVVALQFHGEDEQENDTLNVAAALGCQVAGVHPGVDLATALRHGVGAGSR